MESNIDIDIDTKTFLEIKNDKMKDSYNFIDNFIKNKELDMTVTLMYATADYCVIKINTKITLKCYSTTEDNKMHIVYYVHGQESTNEPYEFYKNLRKIMILNEICELLKIISEEEEEEETILSKYKPKTKFVKKEVNSKEEIISTPTSSTTISTSTVDQDMDDYFWQSSSSPSTSEYFNLSSWWNKTNWWDKYEESKKYREK